MTLRDALKMVAIYERWQAVGAMTGRKLCNSLSSDKIQQRYMECEVSAEHAFFPTFYANDHVSVRAVESVYPVIGIWVKGK